MKFLDIMKRNNIPYTSTYSEAWKLAKSLCPYHPPASLSTLSGFRTSCAYHNIRFMPDKEKGDVEGFLRTLPPELTYEKAKTQLLHYLHQNGFEVNQRFLLNRYGFLHFCQRKNIPFTEVKVNKSLTKVGDSGVNRLVHKRIKSMQSWYFPNWYDKCLAALKENRPEADFDNMTPEEGKMLRAYVLREEKVYSENEIVDMTMQPMETVLDDYREFKEDIRKLAMKAHVRKNAMDPFIKKINDDSAAIKRKIAEEKMNAPPPVKIYPEIEQNGVRVFSLESLDINDPMDQIKMSERFHSYLYWEVKDWKLKNLDDLYDRFQGYKGPYFVTVEGVKHEISAEEYALIGKKPTKYQQALAKKYHDAKMHAINNGLEVPPPPKVNRRNRISVAYNRLANAGLLPQIKYTSRKARGLGPRVAHGTHLIPYIQALMFVQMERKKRLKYSDLWRYFQSLGMYHDAYQNFRVLMIKHNI